MNVHVLPESVEVFGEQQIGLRFTLDALAPCSVRLYWGVSVAACNNLLQNLRGEESGNTSRSQSMSRGRFGRSQAQAAQAQSSDIGPSTALLLAQDIVYTAPSHAEDGPMTGSVLEIPSRSESISAISGSSGSGAAPGTEPTSHRELFSASECSFRSNPIYLPSGVAQRSSTPADDLLDLRRVSFDLAASPMPPSGDQAANRSSEATALVPLVVAATTRRDCDSIDEVQGRPVSQAHSEVTLVRFRRDELEAASSNAEAPIVRLRPEILHQVALGDSVAHRVLGIFGFEDEEETGETECMICYDRRRSVLLLPCRHCSVCSSCLRSLRDERCPLCRLLLCLYSSTASASACSCSSSFNGSSRWCYLSSDCCLVMLF